MKHAEKGPIWSLTVFGWTFGKPEPEPAEPTPLEEATKEYVLTQRMLLRAHERAEDANHEVAKLIERLARLKDDMGLLSEAAP